MRQQLNLFDLDLKDNNLLTPLEEKMIIDNQNLIYKVLYNLKLNNCIDDYYDLGAIALVDAVKSYDQLKGSLSSYLYKSIKWTICNYLSNNSNFSEVTLTDLESSVYSSYSNDYEESADLESTNILMSEYNLEDEIENREKVRIVFSLLNNRTLFTEQEKEIFCDYFGFTRAALTRGELSHKLGIKPETVNSYAKRIMNKLQKQIRKLYGGEYGL